MGVDGGGEKSGEWEMKGRFHCWGLKVLGKEVNEIRKSGVSVVWLGWEVGSNWWKWNDSWVKLGDGSGNQVFVSRKARGTESYVRESGGVGVGWRVVKNRGLNEGEEGVVPKQDKVWQ
ncbi:uncharacterized protein HKW66_Vig0234050 [Vigna angularis]|uniref:Uncharacterized protein n=1 Tax=Phaseolus angularis TaxID=3914 RepID=A0A8T0KSJ9_PHAAN|nr:uncharacterized protein HKW66_Vig0234050 [Vigna angularis]